MKFKITDLEEVTTINEQLQAIHHQMEYLTLKINLGTLSQQSFDVKHRNRNFQGSQVIIRNKSIIQACATQTLGVLQEFKIKYEARLKDLGVEV